MPAVAPSITEDDIIVALGAYLHSIVDCEVVRAQGNRVPMPEGPCIVVTPLHQSPLATNVSTYDPNAQTRAVRRSTEWRAQLDCYGAGSSERAAVVSTLFRDTYGCEFFAERIAGVQPLYATDARQGPLVDGSKQYEDRWTFELVMQINPTVTLKQESALSLEIGTAGNPVTAETTTLQGWNGLIDVDKFLRQ
ncbi:phage neck terminator protein [Paraburkholderia youngii]|uniref:phage neck terminator protein n=1 Tax=Paraburkholderia youngii TaxID=2782701 RepID=UPI003D256800